MGETFKSAEELMAQVPLTFSGIIPLKAQALFENSTPRDHKQFIKQI